MIYARRATTSSTASCPTSSLRPSETLTGRFRGRWIMGLMRWVVLSPESFWTSDFSPFCARGMLFHVFCISGEAFGTPHMFHPPHPPPSQTLIGLINQRWGLLIINKYTNNEQQQTNIHINTHK